MTEKVIHEVRVVETEDGFRIEVKGDKERLREMGCGPGMGFARRFGRRFRHRGGPGFGPWWMCADWWAGEEPAEEEA
jgi:hypothetical protein